MLGDLQLARRTNPRYERKLSWGLDARAMWLSLRFEDSKRKSTASLDKLLFRTRVYAGPNVCDETPGPNHPYVDAERHERSARLD